MNYRDQVVSYVSPGARLRLGYTVDAEASSPLSPIRELHSRLSSAERAIAALCMEPDDAGGSRDPESGDDTDGAVTDRRRRVRDVGAMSVVGGRKTGYEISTGSDVDPDDERDRVASSLKYQNAKNDGPNRRADGSGSTGDDLPDTPADINSKNRQFWKTPKSSETMSAMGSPSTTPSPGAGRESEAFVGGRQAGTISGRSSRTAKTLRMGETFGTPTTDSMRRGQRIIAGWEAQSSAAIASIASKWEARR